jgi:hypothetical protein
VVIVLRVRDVGTLTSSALASASEAAADQDRQDSSLRLAILAADDDWRRPAHPAAGSALVRSMEANRLQLFLPEPAVSVAFSPDGQRLFTASRDGKASAWDAQDGRLLHEMAPRHDGAIRAAALRRDGLQMLTASEDHSARLWDAASGRPLGSPMQHRHAVTSASFSLDGRRLITSDGEEVRVWEVTPQAKAAGGVALKDTLMQLPGQGMPRPPAAQVVRAAFSVDGQRALVSSSQLALVLDAPSGRAMTPALQHCNGLQLVATSADGEVVASVDEQKMLRLRAARPAAPEATRPRLLPVNLPPGAAATRSAGASADASQPSHDELVAGLRTRPPVVELDRSPTLLALSPDGRMVMVVDVDGASIRLSHEPREHHARLPPDGEPRVAAFAPGNRFAMLAAGQGVQMIGLDPSEPWGQRLALGAAVRDARISEDEIGRAHV